MTTLTRLNSSWKQVPAVIQKFLLRGLLLLALWKTAYVFYLGPTATLDGPLTRAVGQQTTWLMNLLSPDQPFHPVYQVLAEARHPENQLGPAVHSAIYYKDKRVLTIADACNGLELFILYAGFILCFPTSWKRKGYYTLVGLPFIHGINLVRCAALGYISILKPQALDFAHHYLFKVMVYGAILLLWWLFTKKIVLNPTDADTALA